MTHCTILATLLLASGAATCAALGNNPAFEARQAARAAQSKLDWQISAAAYTFRKFTFFWDTSDKLLAMVVNVSCPSQEVEHSDTIDADYWGEVRQGLHQAHGEDVVVIGLCGAAGDLSPHLRYRQAADDRMRELRKLSRNQEIARRIVQGVEEVYERVSA